MIRAGIIGAAGYTAGELIRLLVNHPETEIVFAHSTSHAGEPFYNVHSGLFGVTEQCFSSEYDLNSIDVLFLCAGHGKSSEFWSRQQRPKGLRVIDLAQDYRDESAGYVYGLPEWQRKKISQATLIANPGCYATSIQLGLLPLAVNGRLNGNISVTGISGSTGAGQKATETNHFSWRSNNLSIYKPLTHQHLLEINRNLNLAAGSKSAFNIDFIPVRGDFTRGILSTMCVEWDGTAEEAKQIYTDYYKKAVFTHIYPYVLDLKQVVNTNMCLISIEQQGKKLVISSAIDNLLKGASGQAVQNMNIMFGLKEDTALRLKASAF